MSKLFGPAFENGYVYSDIDAALTHWTKVLGVGPFILFRPFDAPVNYRGKKTTIKLAVALAMWGDLLIELISPLDEKPSIYSEFLKSGNQGLHHIGTLCKNYNGIIENLDQANVSKLQYGEFGTTRYAYFDTVGKFPGTMAEIIDGTEEFMDLLGKCKKVSETWDGTDPVRLFGS
jgi:hypothetical protein